MNPECDGATEAPQTFYVVLAGSGEYLDFSAPVGSGVSIFARGLHIATRFEAVAAALDAIQCRSALLRFAISSTLQIVRVETTQAPGTSRISALPVEENAEPGDLLVLITKDRHGEIIARARRQTDLLVFGPYTPDGHGSYLDSVCNLRPDNILSMWKTLKADFAYSTVAHAAATLALFPAAPSDPRFVAIRRLRLTYQAGKVEYRETILA